MDMKMIVKKQPILAIMRNVPLEKTADYAQAVMEGGVSLFEVALNSKHGLEQIRMLRKRFGDEIMLGAGTAITVEKAKAAIDAGARFLLTPGTPVEVLEYCQKNRIDLIPGVLTPTDIAVSLQYGYSMLKLFPAASMPRDYTKSLKGPFDQTEYMAIGGVNTENIRSFFDAGFNSVGLGSNLLPSKAVEEEDWETAAAFVADLLKKIK